jgi:ferritin
MSLPKALVAAYNEQINLEFESAYAYLGMAIWCDDNELDGFAQWLRAQAAEETQHALRFMRFVSDRDAEVTLSDISATPATYRSAVDVFRAALSHEQKVTAAIGDLYALATEQRDYASLPLLNWFTDEQIEEEATIRSIVADLERISDDSAALVLLDREMGQQRSDAMGQPAG